MLKVCPECAGTGYEDIYIEPDLPPVDGICYTCNGLGYHKVPSTNLMVTIYKKPVIRQLLSIEENINRPNNPEVYEIVEAWVRYNYGNVKYDYCEVDCDEFERIGENWNIEDYL